jgi:hypothetical protein
MEHSVQDEPDARRGAELPVIATHPSASAGSGRSGPRSNDLLGGTLVLGLLA